MKKSVVSTIFVFLLMFLLSCGKETKEQIQEVQTGPKEIVWNIGTEDLAPLDKLGENDYNGAIKIISNIRNKSNSQSMNYLLDSLIASKELVLDIVAFAKSTKDSAIPSGIVANDYTETLQILAFYNKNSIKLDALIKTYIDNLEKSYKTNEIVKLKPELVDGKIAIIYPDHFKTISGFMKVIGAQITLISSYSVADETSFKKFLEENDKYESSTPKDLLALVNYLKVDFKKSSLFNRDLAKQAIALSYMKRGVKELEVSLRALPVFTTEAEKVKNVFAINDGDRNTATYIVDALAIFLKDNGGTLKVGDKTYTANLNKLYQIDIKTLIEEFLKETDGITDSTILKTKIDENIANSTFQGLFPDKVPLDLLKANKSLSKNLSLNKSK